MYKIVDVFVGLSHGLCPWKYLREGGTIKKSVNEN
jgi:hypothetical protein